MININLGKKREKNKIRALSPIAFEEYMATIFKEYGYEVEQTPPTNDGGKDLILQYEGRKYYVECKHFTDGSVGREIIQKLVGAGIVDGDVDGFVVATTSYYNDNAIACMEKSKVPLFLLDLDDIASLFVDSNKIGKGDLLLTDEEQEKLYATEYDGLSERERFKRIFGKYSDYTQAIEPYHVNHKTIKPIDFLGYHSVKCAYRFNNGYGRSGYRELIFVLGIDKYFMSYEGLWNDYKNEVIECVKYETPLQGKFKGDFTLSQLRDYVFSHYK